MPKGTRIEQHPNLLHLLDAEQKLWRALLLHEENADRDPLNDDISNGEDGRQVPTLRNPASRQADDISSPDLD